MVEFGGGRGAQEWSVQPDGDGDQYRDRGLVQTYDERVRKTLEIVQKHTVAFVDALYDEKEAYPGTVPFIILPIEHSRVPSLISLAGKDLRVVVPVLQCSLNACDELGDFEDGAVATHSSAMSLLHEKADYAVEIDGIVKYPPEAIPDEMALSAIDYLALAASGLLHNEGIVDDWQDQLRASQR